MSEWLKSYTIDNRYTSRVNRSVYISVCSQQENVTWRNPPHELFKSCGQIDPPSLYFRSAFTRADGQRLSIRRGVESVVSSPKERETPGVLCRGINGLRCDTDTHKYVYTHSPRHGISLSATIFPDSASY